MDAPPHDDRCSLCARVTALTFHHLLPKTCHSNKWFKKRFSKEDMQNRGIYVCRACHNFIHTRFAEKELGRTYNTTEQLLADDKIREFIEWVRKQR